MCIHCDEGEQLYCYQCRSIPLDMCYYKHQLKMVVLANYLECQICGKSNNRFKHCPKCAFYACLECVCLTLNLGHSMEVEDPEHETGKISSSEIEIEAEAEEESIIAE